MINSLRKSISLKSFCWLWSAAAVIVLCGCGNSSEQPASDAHANNPPARMPVELRLTIVDDPALAESISQLRGEWKAQTSVELKIENMPGAQLSTVEKLDADAVIYPSPLLGLLAERRLIRPLNQTWLAGDPLEAADLLEPLDSLELTWDGQPYAVPLGSPVPVLMYRPDLFEQYGKQPPRTWEEYAQLATFFNDQKQLRHSTAQHAAASDQKIAEPWSGTVEPLAAGSAGQLLLARAAAYAKHRDYFSVLFDRDTMQPLIAGTPFVKALTELVAATKTEPKDAMSFTPADAARWLLTGHSAMAIGWPADVVKLSADTVPVAFAAIPGSMTAYNNGHAAWEPRRNDEKLSIPLRGISGHLGSVVRGTDSAETAFQLLTWLASNRWSSAVLPTNPTATVFRQSQVDDSSAWFGKAVLPTAAKQYGEILTAALRQSEAVWLPRIPGEAEYMAALDDAVKSAIEGRRTPQQALDDAASQWQQITTKYGKDEQLAAYRKSIKTSP